MRINGATRLSVSNMFLCIRQSKGVVGSKGPDEGLFSTIDDTARDCCTTLYNCYFV